MHQDAHEFLNYLLNKIVEEIQYDKHHKHQDRDKDSSSSNASQEDCEFQAHQHLTY
jgi:ubiquitin C-terminal hydrolase